MDYSFLKKKKETELPVKKDFDYSFLTKKKEEPQKETTYKIDPEAAKLSQPILDKTAQSTPAIAPQSNAVSSIFKKIIRPFTAAGRADAEARTKAEAEKRQADKLLSPEQKAFNTAKSNEKRKEMVAKVITAPIRFTAGSLATAATSFALERADSNAKYTPKTDAEKLIIGENEIQRLSKQEDLYGTVARGVGVPVALTAMAVVENPFIASTGLGKVIKGVVENHIAKLGAEQLSKLGTKQIIKLADDAIKSEKTAGKIAEQDAVKASQIINNFRVKEVKSVEKFSDWKINNPTPETKSVDNVTVKPSAQQTKAEPIKYTPEEKPDLRNKISYERTIAEPSIPNRIKNEVIEKGIARDLQGITEYDKVSFKDQAERVGQIIDENPERAINIALGKELPTNGALPESVFIAVKNQAIKNGDVGLLRRLATEEGGVARESTLLGQRIKMLDEQLEDDAFRNISKVVKERRAAFEAKKGNVTIATKEEVARMKEAVKVAKANKDEWASFVDEITC